MPQLIDEKELEDYLINNLCAAFDLNENGAAKTQVRIGEYGVADIVHVAVNHLGETDITVIEVKKGDIDCAAIGQISRYISGIKSYLDTLSENSDLDKVYVQGILVGASINSRDAKYISNGIPCLKVFTYDIDIADGISFSSQGKWFVEGAFNGCISEGLEHFVASQRIINKSRAKRYGLI